ncbi:MULTISPECIES: hypothetical protein [Cellvibrio]|uniref:Lysylphosphatidylglycerol synthetase-like protein (DUF2156 family) n=1 Tax=Cellvibrio fibrivorans TaxID=126350 RepID=A0ABU1USD1_9GAMM|nr:hypothetical protein [Cellvibrio fibrivorans]MDR7088089.1 lysylphosphatidylglycerol synthetase-like protein (DUF2156 family) [Cellvibrio fibrivorans]
MNNSLPLIADAWRFFKNNLASIIALIMPLIMAVSTFSAAIAHYARDIEYIEYLAMLPYMLTFPIYQCVFILYMSSVISGEFLQRKQYYQLALKLWLPIVGLYIIATIAILTGLLLLIVPAIIVMIRISFSEFYCILYKRSPVDAFRLSWKATKEYQGIIFAGFIIIWLATNVPFWFIKRTFYNMDFWNPITIALYHAAESLFAILLTIFNFRIFTLLPEKPDN